MNTRAPTHSDTESGEAAIMARRWGKRRDGQAPARVLGVPRRRSGPYLLLGVLLVLGCATGGVVVATQLGHHEAVLVLARPVAVGQELAARDVREVSMSMDTGLAAIPAHARSTVEGRTVGYTMPAGTLLTKEVMGDARVPPARQAVIAVGVKAGQYPPDLQVGNHVTVVAMAATDEASGAASSRSSAWEATVTGVHPNSDELLTTVSLQLAQGDARELAAAPIGQINVYVVHGGRR
ncbi:SAF domain-containing protein [Streptomyces sp. NPDC050211]|uniref:SAF domain-containing protein n=1 Tax=Streptomyces sp. NPDC050211 TaxID=3154932 RepID=UPI003435F933